MNKLLFKLERNFNEDIVFICNNVKDLEDHLNTYEWFYFEILNDKVFITEREDYVRDIATLEWVKHI